MPTPNKFMAPLCRVTSPEDVAVRALQNLVEMTRAAAELAGADPAVTAALSHFDTRVEELDDTPSGVEVMLLATAAISVHFFAARARVRVPGIERAVVALAATIRLDDVVWSVACSVSKSTPEEVVRLAGTDSALELMHPTTIQKLVKGRARATRDLFREQYRLLIP